MFSLGQKVVMKDSTGPHRGKLAVVKRLPKLDDPVYLIETAGGEPIYVEEFDIELWDGK